MQPPMDNHHPGQPADLPDDAKAKIWFAAMKAKSQGRPVAEALEELTDTMPYSVAEMKKALESLHRDSTEDIPTQEPPAVETVTEPWKEIAQLKRRVEALEAAMRRLGEDV